MPRSTQDDTPPDPARAPVTDPGLGPRPASSDNSNPTPVPVDALLSALEKKESALPIVQARRTSGERAAAYDAPPARPPQGHDTSPPMRSIVLDIPTDPGQLVRARLDAASRAAPTVVIRRAPLPWWTVPAALGCAVMLTGVGWWMFHDDPPLARRPATSATATTTTTAVPPVASSEPAAPPQPVPAPTPVAPVTASAPPVAPPPRPVASIPSPPVAQPASKPVQPAAQNLPKPPMDLLGGSH